jgi:predicted enzyme related to lactoylglutathione lyase
MTTSRRFCRYDLRTTDPEAARRFYADVLGLDLTGAPSDGEPSMLAVWLLHEQARARGAPPHWLGHIGVTDVDASVERLLELGSERLGATVRASDGAVYATLRDPSGAVVAVRADTRRPRGSPVAWHQLHTRDLDRAWATYSDLFGWTHTETLDVADPMGGYRMFAWEGAEKSVGSMANTARAHGVHAHWLYSFSVTDIEGAMNRVRAHGGKAPEGAIALPNGDRIAPCEDAQGAAFGLHEAAAA